jgi:hypothetical protein
VGIGTTAPARLLSISGGASTAYLQLCNTATGIIAGNGLELIMDSAGLNATITNRENGYLALETNGTERMRIDSSGNLLVGATSVGAYGPNGLLIYKANVASSTAGKNLAIYTTNSLAADMGGGISLGGTYANDGTPYELASIKCGKTNATHGDASGYLTFQTTNSGNAPTERARIDSSGNVGIGTTSPAGKIDCVIGSSQPIYFRREDNGGQNVQIYHDAGGGYVAMGGTVAKDLTIKNLNAAAINVIAGSNGVYLASAATSWASLSDERTKDIIENIADAATKVSSLRAVIGKYKTDSEGTRRSFLIAQDVQAVLPEAVDATNPNKLGLQYSDIIPLLVASIKELTQRVAALESN